MQLIIVKHTCRNASCNSHGCLSRALSQCLRFPWAQYGNWQKNSGGRLKKRKKKSEKKNEKKSCMIWFIYFSNKSPCVLVGGSVFDLERSGWTNTTRYHMCMVLVLLLMLKNFRYQVLCFHFRTNVYLLAVSVTKQKCSNGILLYLYRQIPI